MILMAANANAAFKYDPALSWQTLQSDHFEIHYHDGEEALAERSARICEQQYLETGRVFNWYPKQRTQVVLVNTLDVSNASASPFPVNTMVLYLPASDEPSEEYDDWLRHLITHEYTHIVHLDKSVGAYNDIRRLFGRNQVLFPNVYQPTWIIEGLATYRETRPDFKIGRGQSTLFRSLMQIEWEQGLKPLRQVNLPIDSWPGGTTRYLYGVYFFNFIRDRYGDEAIAKWVDEYSKNWLPWAINRTSWRQFRKSMSELWVDFNQYLGEQFQPVINAVNEEGASQGEAISQIGYFTGNLKRGVRGDLYYIGNNLLSPPQLYRQASSGSTPQSVMTIYGQSYDVSDQGIVFNQHELQHSTNYYYEIYLADIDGGHVRQLTEGGRYSYVLWANKDILAVQQNGIREQIQLLDQKGQVLKTIWQGQPGELISKPVLSRDGTFLLAAVWRAHSRWEIEIMDIAKGTWQALTHNAGNELAPVFSQDGESIYFIADYQNKIFNIYRMPLNGSKLQRVSNDLHGIVEVAELSPSQLAYVGLHAEGSDIYQMPSTLNYRIDERNEMNTEVPQMPQVSNDKTVDYSTNPYSAFSRIAPVAWFPFFYADADNVQWGFETQMSDPLNWHNYTLTAAFDNVNQWGVGQLGYLYDRYNPALNLFVNRYVSTENNGNDEAVNWLATQQSAAALLFPWLKRDIHWRFDLGVASEKTSLVKTIVAETRSDLRSNIAMLALNFSNAKQFSRSINLSQGHRVRVTRENFIDEENVDKPAYALDWRYYYTLRGNHSLATHIVRAKSDDNDPYQLGGNYQGYTLSPLAMPYLSEAYTSVHQRNYALRGYSSGLTQLSGSDVAIAEIEYRFPIRLIESGFMAPPLGINQIHGNVFYSAATPQWSDRREQYYRSIGAESKFDLILGYVLPLSLQIGYAHGLDGKGDEMWYVRLGGSF